MTAINQALIDKIRALPRERLSEVEDFIDFVASRARDVELARAAGAVSEVSFAAVWDNDDDAAYDAL